MFMRKNLPRTVTKFSSRVFSFLCLLTLCFLILVLCDVSTNAQSPNWKQEFPLSGSPPPRYDYAMSTAQNGNVLIFGGATVENGFSYMSDTWVWDGLRWTNITTLISGRPPVRGLASMAFDEAHNQVVLFGAQGDIVGVYNADPGGLDHGFLLRGENFTTIDVPGALNSDPSGINSRGDIVGSYDDGVTPHGFLLRGNSFTTIDFPGAIATFLQAISDADGLVGSYADAGGNDHGFLLSHGAFTTIDFPGSAGTHANGISDSGDVAGFYVDNARARHGFLLSRGSFSTIAPAGAIMSQAFGINARGDIVGNFRGADNVPHAFLFTETDPLLNL